MMHQLVQDHFERFAVKRVIGWHVSVYGKDSWKAPGYKA